MSSTPRPATSPEPPADAVKVPAVTLLFWLIKIAATTFGETAGDAFTMSLGLGYLIGTLVFGALFAGAVILQIRCRRFNAPLYWFAIITTTTVGTTLADFADRSLGIGYAGGTTLLVLLLGGTLVLWKRKLGTVAIGTVGTPAAERFYWVTILFSQTLGTALGDWTADTAGLGYLGAGLIFAGLLALVALAYFFRWGSRTALFWLAFVLTRPLGAALGDYLDKPVADGGLALSRFTASGALLVFMILCIALFRQRPAERTH